jgi:hypothetical protein
VRAHDCSAELHSLVPPVVHVGGQCVYVYVIRAVYVCVCDKSREMIQGEAGVALGCTHKLCLFVFAHTALECLSCTCAGSWNTCARMQGVCARAYETNSTK